MAIIAGVVLGTGCASFKNTPAQDLAWERWQKCNHFPTIQLKEIRPNGQIWVTYTEPAPLAGWKACDAAAYAEQQRAGRLAATQAPLPTPEATALVRYAYFTNVPPVSGSYLSPVGGDKRPPEVKEFALGTPVTFFYAINQVGRLINIETKWVGPNGAAKSFKRVMDQTGRAGTWSWQTQTVEATELAAPGTWTVELVIDGYRVGEHRFTVR